MPELIIDTTPALMRKNILRLAWPAILRLFLQSIVGVVDVIMIGRLGASAIASVDMANRLVFVLIGTLMALTVGSTAMVAQSVGAGDEQKANQIMWQSLLGGFMIAFLLGGSGFIFSRQLLEGMMVLMEDADPFILTEGTIYLRIVFISMIFALPMMVINSILQGVGDMKTPLFIMVITNIINVVFNYLLIFGIGFFPALGVQGAAWGSSLARLTGTAVGLFILIRGTGQLKLNWRHASWKMDWPIIRDLVNVGIPAAIENLVRQSSMIIYTALVAALGTVTLAANAITMNINSMLFMPGFGFGMAATTLVGQALGARRKDLAARYARQTTLLTVIMLVIASLLILIFINPIIRLYTDQSDVIGLTRSALTIFIIFQPCFGIFMVLAGALRGAGDTKWVMYSTMVGNWGIRLIFSLIFVFWLDMGLNGFWLAMGIDILIRSLMIMVRFKSGKWQNLNVMKTIKPKTAAEPNQIGIAEAKLEQKG